MILSFSENLWNCRKDSVLDEENQRPVKKRHEATYQDREIASIGTLGIMSQSTGVLGSLVGNGLLFPVLADVGWFLPLHLIYGKLYILCHCQKVHCVACVCIN